ncbi:hypothetical protein [Bacillus sp. JJ722]|uniref:hypothetical protein n=1 Tax=Bacillus sp. JJ722 TaxID=3122973 RepID=UPI002FFDBCE7
MKSFKLDDKGDFDIKSYVEGEDLIIQNIKHLVITRIGEWLLNENYGFNRSVVEGKKVNERDITEALYDAILQEPQLKEITKLTFNFDPYHRQLQIDFEATTTGGGVISANF